VTVRDLARVLALAACAAACHPTATAPPARGIRFLHTFGARESELLDHDLASWPEPVTTSLVPFARGQTVIGALLRGGRDCPDLIRIDATWLPALARAALRAPAPGDVAGARWLPEARALATDRGTMWAAPQTVDGLVVLIGPAASRPGVLPPAPPTTIDQLTAAGEQARRAGVRWGLGLRVDGYWLVPFLRAAGADVADGATGTLGIDRPGAAAAVARFASLFGQVAAPAAPPGQEAAVEARRFRAGEVALLVTGPWAIPDAAKGELDQLRVWPMPDAPRGGQLLVVPRCAAAPAAAWRFARHLTAPEVQAAWARELGTVPTTKAALDAAPRAVQETYAALRSARPLPRDPMTALLFDDLTPAVAAVVAGDATADEALAGVRRAWARMLAARDDAAGAGASDGGVAGDDAPDGGAP
jgi:arabinogalactan oligomer / maltooligosaccharide transport system substrate-binding protein